MAIAISVLFTTGYARGALDRQQGFGSQIELLLKPFDIEDLAAKIRAILY